MSCYKFSVDFLNNTVIPPTLISGWCDWPLQHGVTVKVDSISTLLLQGCYMVRTAAAWPRCPHSRWIGEVTLLVWIRRIILLVCGWCFPFSVIITKCMTVWILKMIMCKYGTAVCVEQKCPPVMQNDMFVILRLTQVFEVGVLRERSAVVGVPVPLKHSLQLWLDGGLQRLWCSLVDNQCGAGCAHKVVTWPVRRTWRQKITDYVSKLLSHFLHTELIAQVICVRGVQSDVVIIIFNKSLNCE